jgi:hypothetical protein
MKIYTRITNGQMSDEAEVAWVAELSHHEGKDIAITIERKRKKRSLNQNAFLHGPFIESLKAMHLHYGNEYDEGLVKDMFKRQFGVKMRVENVDGTHYYIEKPTRDYTTLEAEECMEACRRFYAEYWQIPYPNETIEVTKEDY